MSTVRFVIFGDLHFDDKPPRCRSSSYADEVIAKLAWVRDLCIKLKATPIHTGDLFHRPRPSLSAVARLAGVLSTFHVAPYTLIGNHDMIDHTSITGTGFEVILRAGLLRLLPSSTADDSSLTYPGGGFVIAGAHYDPDERPALYSRTARRGDVEVRVTHGMLMAGKRRPVPFPATFVHEIDKLPDVLVNGHYHHPWSAEPVRARPVHTQHHVHNVGSLARVASDQTSQRIVLVVQWSPDSGALTVRTVNVPMIAEPFTQHAPQTSTRSTRDATAARVDDFVTALDAETAVEFDPVAMLDAIDVSPAARERARNYLMTAKERLT